MAPLARCCLLLACMVVCSGDASHQYCVVGAGPGGLQTTHYLVKAGRDVVMYDSAADAGSFFTKYPIHRQLISLNKRHTGRTNREFNLRHGECLAWYQRIGCD